jgi:hypothetical protein
VLISELGRTSAMGLTVGERDLAAGLDAYVRRVTKAKLPVLAANLLSKATGKAPFPAHRVVTVGGVKVGIAGVAHAAPFTRLADVEIKPSFAESAAAQRKALAAAGAELFVLLAHTSVRDLKEIVPPSPPVQGWNVIVTGHDRRGRSEPERIGGALVVSGGDRGRQVGLLTLSLEGKPPWKDLANAGEVAMLKEEIGRMADRRKYYERMMAREGLKAQSKKFYGDRLAQMDKDKAEKQAKLDEAKKRPTSGSRYQLTMAPMNAQIVDDPACAQAIAPSVLRLAALKPKKGGHDSDAGHDDGPGGHGPPGFAPASKLTNPKPALKISPGKAPLAAPLRPAAAGGPSSSGASAPKTKGARRPAAKSPTSAPAGAGR